MSDETFSQGATYCIPDYQLALLDEKEDGEEGLVEVKFSGGQLLSL